MSARKHYVKVEVVGEPGEALRTARLMVNGYGITSWSTMNPDHSVTPEQRAHAAAQTLRLALGLELDPVNHEATPPPAQVVRVWTRIGTPPGYVMHALEFMRIERLAVRPHGYPGRWRAWDALRVPSVRPMHPTTFHPTLKAAKKHCEGIVSP